MDDVDEKDVINFSQAEREREKNKVREEEKQADDEAAFLDLAIKRLKKCIDRDDHNRKASIEDLRFSNGLDQWDEKVKNERTKDGRPCLQFDLLTESIAQMVGDQRHNKIKNKVRPVDSESDPEIARIRQGLINNIEYSSGAERIYDYAFEMMCRGAYGAWEIKTRYTEENPFLQEIYLQRVENPHTIYMGPGSDECYADSPYGFKLLRVNVDDFKEMYPKAEVPGDSLKTGKGMGYEHWWDGELVTIADYYIVKKVEEEMALLSDGRVMSKEKAEKEVSDMKAVANVKKVIGQSSNALNMGPSAPKMNMEAIPTMPSGVSMSNALNVAGSMSGSDLPPQQIQQSMAETNPLSTTQNTQEFPDKFGTPSHPIEDSGAELKIVKTRSTYLTKIKHYTITALEILSKGGLDGEDFPGEFIPLILAHGPEINVDGKSYIRSYIRPAKDPQRNYNYWVSAAAESVALAPKAEWIGTAKQFEGYENDYAASNQKNLPFLKYNVDDENLPEFVPPPPMRVAVKDPPIGIFTEMANAKMAVKDGLGMHNRDLGDTGPERSGAAIVASQRPSDISSFIFFDNLKRAIEHSCRVINSMIGDVYDSERDVRLRDETDSETFAPINTTIKDAIERISGNPYKYQGMDINKLKGEMSKNGTDARFNDITVGKYDIVSTTGPAYATQRTESAEQLLRLASVDKRIMALGGDLVVRSMDFLHSDELAERLEKTLPPGMMKPKEGKPPVQPPPPPPQVQVLMQKAKTEEIKQKKELEKVAVEKLKIQLKMIEIANELQDSNKELRGKVLDILNELHDPTPIPGEPGWNPENQKGGSR